MNEDRPVDLSVIIVNLNTVGLLRDCLASVQAETGLALEIIVIDNGSTDGSPEMVSAEFPAVRLIRNATNRGFAPANNQGLAVARGRYCLLLNSDTRVWPGALLRLVAFMDAHPEAGACGPQLLNADGSLQPSGRAFPTLASVLAELLPVPARWRRRVRGSLAARDYGLTCEVDEVSGAALCLRRAALKIAPHVPGTSEVPGTGGGASAAAPHPALPSAFDQVGLLDEDFFFLGEDVDLCWRLKSAGWKVYYVSEARIVHLWGGSRRDRDGAISLLAQRGYYLLFRKHRSRGEAGLLKAVVVVLTLLKLGKWLVIAGLRGDREAARKSARLHLAELGWLLRH